jgi:hypothetical protein
MIMFYFRWIFEILVLWFGFPTVSVILPILIALNVADFFPICRLLRIEDFESKMIRVYFAAIRDVVEDVFAIPK